MEKDEIHYLRNLLKLANHKIVNLSKPYDLTINEIEYEIRSLESLQEILETYENPVNIKLEAKTFGKRK